MNLVLSFLIVFTIEGVVFGEPEIKPFPDNALNLIRLKEKSIEAYKANLYKGISLANLLEGVEFKGHIANLYAIIIGEKDTVVASLSEIMYPWNFSEVIYATEREIIVPAGLKDKIRPKRDKIARIIFAEDNYPVRIVDNPAKLVVKRGIPRTEKKDNSNMYAPYITLKYGEKNWKITEKILRALRKVDIERVIYGYHRGFHGKCIYSGVPMRDIINKFRINVKHPQRTVIHVKAPDGYTVVFSWYELVNSKKSDLYIIADKVDGNPLLRGEGKFRLIAHGDFFADRSVRSVEEIIIEEVKF